MQRSTSDYLTAKYELRLQCPSSNTLINSVADRVIPPSSILLVEVHFETTLVIFFPSGCCGTVEATMTSAGPNCTFTEVYPDAEVHWFLGSRRLTGGSPRHSTREQVEESGWMTVHSHLEKDNSGEPYNCSLWCRTSRQYITSSLVVQSVQPPHRLESGATAQRAMGTSWFISGLLAVMMK